MPSRRKRIRHTIRTSGVRGLSANFMMTIVTHWHFLREKKKTNREISISCFFCVELSWTKKEYFYFSVIFEKTRNVNCVSVRLSHKLHPPALIQGIFIFVPNRATPLANILFQFSTWLPVHATPPLTSCSRPSAHSKKKINSIVKGFFFCRKQFLFRWQCY